MCGIVIRYCIRTEEEEKGVRRRGAATAAVPSEITRSGLHRWPQTHQYHVACLPLSTLCMQYVYCTSVCVYVCVTEAPSAVTVLCVCATGTLLVTAAADASAAGECVPQPAQSPPSGMHLH